FVFANGLNMSDVEISDDVFIISKETAEAYLQAPKPKAVAPDESLPQGSAVSVADSTKETPSATDSGTSIPPAPDSQPPSKPASATTAARMTWTGEIPAQKWTNFYTKVLTKFSAGKGLRITLQLEIAPENGISPQKIEETRIALRELGLSDEVKADY
ncbi:MAG TPA: hypothetical protein VEF04_07305, partial [Blastocatellia bacterium]|nr:hypothetical protein [Blastocatellia bacterium]